MHWRRSFVAEALVNTSCRATMLQVANLTFY
nr:MAG TPA: hypothetical protein [Caudoviricetes sp.]DAF72501.1 MAG TPA: hypothetical protein [Caudoviricetes sp.]